MTEFNGRPSPLERAEAIAPLIAQVADQIDDERQLPQEIVDELKSNGMFRLLVPRSLGGEEMDWLEYLDVIRTVAYADGSAGWCLNQGSVFGTWSARAPRPLAEEVWSDPITTVGNGPPVGGSSATKVAGGYQLTGDWMFSSGSRHATWMAGIVGGRGEPVRMHIMPKSEVEFVDLWDVKGLRGTGSFGFRVQDHFVPESRVMLVDAPPLEDGPLYKIPIALLFACGFGCVALGVARAGLDAAIELATDKKPQFKGKLLAHEPVVQSQIGQAEAQWRAAKAFLHESVGNVWDAVQSNGAITLEERVLLRIAGTHAIRQSAQVVDIAYNLSGSTAIFGSKKIQRRFQDAHVITQQVQGREAHYQAAGEFFLGLDPTEAMF